MRLRFIVLFVTYLAMQCISAQTSFQKVVESGTALMRNPKMAADGKHFYLQGISSSGGLRKAYLSQFDENGAILWSKSFGNPINESNVVDIFPLDDGILIPLGEINNAGKSVFFLVKLDLLGNEVWNIEMGESTIANAPLLSVDAAKNIWISYDLADVFNINESMLVKVAPTGQIIFTKKFNQQNTVEIKGMQWSEKANALLVFGQMYPPFGIGNVLFSVNPIGQIKWLIRGVDFRFNQMQIMDDKVLLLSIKNASQAADIISIHNIFTGKILQNSGFADTEAFVANDNGFLVQYSNDNILVAYDKNLKSLWSFSYATCSMQPFVELDMNKKGDFLIWKKINDKVLITKPLPNGKLKPCGEDLIPPPALLPPLNISFENLPIFPTEDLPQPNKSKIAIQNVNTFSVKDYCPIFPQAAFTIPDTICRFTIFTPQGSNPLQYKELWRYDGNKLSTSAMPELQISSIGKNEVLHIVENGTCSDTVKHFIQVLDAPEITFKDTVLCGVENAFLNFAIKGGVKYTLDGVPILYPIRLIEKAGEYQLKVSNGFCESEKKFKVNFIQKPDIQFVVDSIYCKNAVYEANVKGFDKVFWDNKNTTSISINDAEKHFYKAILGSCETNGVLQIQRKECSVKFFVPTVFSPNEDGINDFFEPLGDKIELIEMRIFNRWGGLVFQSSSSEIAWNGKENGKFASEGVYAYKIFYKDLRTLENKTVFGEVTLMR